jgi:hypothetical protein
MEALANKVERLRAAWEEAVCEARAKVFPGWAADLTFDEVDQRLDDALLLLSSYCRGVHVASRVRKDLGKAVELCLTLGAPPLPSPPPFFPGPH